MTIERIKTKPGYKFLAVLFILALPIYLLHLDNEHYLNSIKNDPNIDVTCNIKGEGWVSIDKSKIIDVDDNGVFIFKNGYASNCVVNDNN